MAGRSVREVHEEGWQEEVGGKFMRKDGRKKCEGSS